MLHVLSGFVDFFLHRLQLHLHALHRRWLCRISEGSRDLRASERQELVAVVLHDLLLGSQVEVHVVPHVALVAEVLGVHLVDELDELLEVNAVFFICNTEDQGLEHLEVVTEREEALVQNGLVLSILEEN